MDRWRDKVAVVTGASSGIGAAVAQKFVEEGLQVVGLARRVERIEELARKLEGKPGKLHAVRCDMTKQNDIIEAIEWTTKNVGPVNILINNAGLGKSTTIINGNIDDWKTILDTNVLGLAIATREAVRVMQEHKIDGHIVNVNSIVGHTVPSLPLQNMYPASKHAVTAFTETLRKDLVEIGSKIKVSSVSPGYVDTEIFIVNGYMQNEGAKKLLDMAPSLQPEDVANAIVYMVGTPPHVQIAELIIKPVGEFV